MAEVALLGAVLCGGASSRMGTDKAELPHPSGGTYLRHALARLRPITPHLAIAGRAALPSSIARADQDRTWTDTIIALPDAERYQGPLSGVVTSLRWARSHSLPAALVTPVDMPRLDSADLRQLVRAFAGSPEIPAAACFVDLDRGERPCARPEPLVAIYPVSALETLEQRLASHDRGLSSWLAAQPHQTVMLESASGLNVNTPRDFETRR